MANDAATDVVKADSYFTESDLTAIKSFNDVGAFLKQEGILTDSLKDYGNGFEVLDNKASLIDVTFVILDYRFSKGDNGEFVSLTVVTKDNRKLIVNDGSTGVRDQIKAIAQQRLERGIPDKRPIMVEHGLKGSTYQRNDADGNKMFNDDGSPMMATTYYLA
ncbi:MAG: hypothetical protein KDA17_05545 [Candidatus Saccharibacteria bacterium]|nr:hypothetical protein [Candidatus Saccharibacteria bacterium]